MAASRQTLFDLHPFWRTLIYLLGLILLLLALLQALVSIWGDQYVAGAIQKQIADSRDQAHTLHFKDLDLNLFTGSATVSGITIQADTAHFSDTLGASPKPPARLFRGTVGTLDIRGVSWLSSLLGRELHIDHISLLKPDITVLQNPYDPKSKGSFSSVDSTIYAAFSGQYQALEIGEFSIQNGQATVLRSKDTLSTIRQLDLSLHNIRVDSASAHSGRLFITDELSTHIRGFRIKLPDRLNIIAFADLRLSSEDQRITVDSLQLIPRYPKFEYSRRHGSTIDRIELTIPTLQFRDVDVDRLTESGRFYARYAKITGARLEDFLNRSLSGGGPPRPRPLPFIAFRDLKQQIKIDSLRISDTFISYSEYLGQSPRAGTVTFENLNAVFRKISNYPGDIKAGITTTLDAQTQVMGQGLLNAHFRFPMDTQIGFHKIKGQLGSMPITDFNRMLEDVAYVRADRGMLHSLEFDMTLNEDRSNGTVIMKYENLKISVLDKQSTRQKGLKEHLTTFLANNFLVRENNTPEAGMQAGQIKFQRIKSKSIFNYWWKSLLSGIKDSIRG